MQNKKEILITDFLSIRKNSEKFTVDLQIEDYGLQAITETNPAKWHLAHTSWFFETFLLNPFLPNYKCFHPEYETLFNSYYALIGTPFERSKRGLLSRPVVKEVYKYRTYITDHVPILLKHVFNDEIANRLELGIQHEMQYQELFFTDIKYNFFQNPLRPTYRELTKPNIKFSKNNTEDWQSFPAKLIQCGIPDTSTEFHFDNKTPSHPVWLQPFAIHKTLVTNAHYLEFIENDGYSRQELWLSDGWDFIQENHINASLCWEKNEKEWNMFTLTGMQSVNPKSPICHVSYYEADAFARWKNCRLPTEFEWEHATTSLPVQGKDLSSDILHPIPTKSGDNLSQFYGDVWEWTSSAYSPYPGFRPNKDAIGEYNGKFMSNQFILRGGSCVTPKKQIRKTYRNFFPPNTRWQFSGIQLAKNISI